MCKSRTSYRMNKFSKRWVMAWLNIQKSIYIYMDMRVCVCTFNLEKQSLQSPLCHFESCTCMPYILANTPKTKRAWYSIINCFMIPVYIICGFSGSNSIEQIQAWIKWSTPYRRRFRMIYLVLKIVQFKKCHRCVFIGVYVMIISYQVIWWPGFEQPINYFSEPMMTCGPFY